MIELPPGSTLFPYTTLFRSKSCDSAARRRVKPTSTLPPALFQRPNCAATSFGSDRKSTRLNSSHRCISYAVFCLKKKNYIEIKRTVKQSASERVGVGITDAI